MPCPDCIQARRKLLDGLARGNLRLAAAAIGEGFRIMVDKDKPQKRLPPLESPRPQDIMARLPTEIDPKITDRRLLLLLRNKRQQ